MMQARLQAKGEANGLSRSPCGRYRRNRGARHRDGWRADRSRRCLPRAVYRSGGSRSLCVPRSEEHTSELPSRPHLVCRLLLEKKKKKIIHLSLVQKKKKKTNK